MDQGEEAWVGRDDEVVMDPVTLDAWSSKEEKEEARVVNHITRSFGFINSIWSSLAKKKKSEHSFPCLPIEPFEYKGKTNPGLEMFADVIDILEVEPKALEPESEKEKKEEEKEPEGEPFEYKGKTNPGLEMFADVIDILEVEPKALEPESEKEKKEEEKEPEGG
ncbi:hypothetical protein JCGZ_12664 [Jatropha curcas]|uniref:Uncharacterized protein n=1 Tax=Jatropha curcas TaxID=180498 RepID=A0A067KDM5_JATCU|nr:hypothetical protein JCGZ_12664 [Jatropha curcas]